MNTISLKKHKPLLEEYAKTITRIKFIQTEVPWVHQTI